MYKTDFNLRLLAIIYEKTFQLVINSEYDDLLKRGLSFCWSWIENAEVDINDIYLLLDGEDGYDLCYVLEEEYASEKYIEYEILFKIISCFSRAIYDIMKKSSPQFLDIVDDEYYLSIFEEIKNGNITSCSYNDIVRIEEKLSMIKSRKITRNELLAL